MAFRNYLEGEDDAPYYKINSLAHYYEEMERYAALIKEMTGHIKDYGNELGLTKEEIDQKVTAYILQNKAQLDQRLGEWDEKLQQFDGSVTDLLAEWVDDGTLNHIIDTTLIDEKVAPLTLQLADMMINVKSVFSVVGDGVTDDTVKIKTALNSNHQTLFFPDGVYNITDSIIVNSGSHKKVIGGENTVFSITLSSSKTMFNLFKNIIFENITFDFNNSYCVFGLNFNENLGEIILKNIVVKNIKDTDNKTATIAIRIMTNGNTVNLDGVMLENILKRGNGIGEDLGGTLEGIYTNGDEFEGGVIKNVVIKNMHSIDSNDAIITEACNAIYIAANFKRANLILENIRGYDFGKRLIKTQASALTIKNIFAESYTNDVMVAVGIQEGEDVTLDNVKLRGKMNMGVTSSAINTKVSNMDINIEKALLIGTSSYGVRLYADNFTMDKTRIKADSGFSVGKFSGTGPVKNTKISNVTFEVIGAAATSAILFPEGFEGFENLTLENVTIIRESNSGKAIDFNQTNTLTKNLVIKNLLLIDSHDDLNWGYGISGKRLIGMTIDGFSHVNKKSGTVYRSIKLNDSSDFIIKNCHFPLASSSSSEFTNCLDLSFSDIIGQANKLIVLTMSNAKLGNVPYEKVNFTDTFSRNAGTFSQESMIGTSIQRPTTPKLWFQYFDTTLGKPIFCKQVSPVVWVDSNGATV